MTRPGRARVALLLTVVTAALLTACTGTDTDQARADATATTQPTPAPTSSPTPGSPPPPSPTASPTPSTAAEIAEAVAKWYTYGGETAVVTLVKEARNAESARPREAFDLVILDFGGLTEALSTARLMGSIPDPKTQTAWAAAIEHLDGAVRQVSNSVPKDGRTIQSPQETGQMLRGWSTFDEGIKSLKAAQALLNRRFGLKPSVDPWEVEQSPSGG
ncbi:MULTISPECIES: hypothetical protein [Streptomyces]|uniref:hypothetical protein n=1 Tax=Streptomyces TaxID=1883 RepID=UPI0004CAFCAC|nr:MULTISPECIES: hypothetical protein [Streptomyces]MDX2916805.1 hypothetical protein [Streptomyces sp. NE06-03C]MDX3605204.1 hypothetical protein [Streptomyces sp. FL06-04B]MDX3736085.1 hypothetical protein [Streptomyces sp. ID01-15D]